VVFVQGDVVTAGQFGAYMLSVSGMLLYQHSRKHPELTDEVIINAVKDFLSTTKPQTEPAGQGQGEGLLNSQSATDGAV
jgi:hypothetical protein